VSPDLCFSFATGINDTGGKFAIGLNATGGKPEVENLVALSLQAHTFLYRKLSVKLYISAEMCMHVESIIVLSNFWQKKTLPFVQSTS
jgi:hypothetical protein